MSQPPRKPHSWDLPCQQAPCPHLTLLKRSADPTKPLCLPILLLAAQPLYSSKTRAFPAPPISYLGPLFAGFPLE